MQILHSCIEEKIDIRIRFIYRYLVLAQIKEEAYLCLLFDRGN